MAPLPKRKISTFRGGKRFASRKTELRSFTKCQKCSKKKRPHHLCQNCEM